MTGTTSALLSALQIEHLDAARIALRLPAWSAEFSSVERSPGVPSALSSDPAWLLVLSQAFKQTAHCLEAQSAGRVVGLLPLIEMKSLFFGKFFVSLPYLNTAGVRAADHDVSMALIGRAVELADRLEVRYLELRHEARQTHPAFNHETSSKVHLRLPLPASADALWSEFDPKVRNQIRKGEKADLTVHWGGRELLADFYAVFSHNMRDLGTPVYGQELFRNILETFPDRAELCVVRQGAKPIAAALLTHGAGVTEVPSASSLREFNATNANMLMYWHLLQRAIERGQQMFDFGRSTAGSNTYRFKTQWGATPHPAVWQYYVRKGDVSAMRPDSSRNQRLVRIWQRLPVALTRWIGPAVVRGIP